MAKIAAPGRDYTEPLGSKLPALEQNILKYRAMNLILALFYAEQLQRTIVNLVQGTDKIMRRDTPRVVPGIRKPVDKALTALVADRAITSEEKAEIVGLIDYRNFIGHQMHNLLSDVGGTWAHKYEADRADRTPRFDESAVKRLRHYRKRLGGLRDYVHTVSFAPLAFESAEKTFLREIQRLRHRIERLVEIRDNEIRSVKAELSLAGTGLEDDRAPWHHTMRHIGPGARLGRLTKRGVETVYRLFDLGKSPMAVAHLTGLSLDAVKRRRKMWQARR